LSELLDEALGSTTAAIHWDLARETLRAASGLPTRVGLEAEPEPGPVQVGIETPPTGDQPTKTPALGSTPSTTDEPSADQGAGRTRQAVAAPGT
jgi:hypothetical protein